MPEANGEAGRAALERAQQRLGVVERWGCRRGRSCGRERYWLSGSRMKVVAVWIGGITALVEGSTQPIAWAARVDGFASGSLMPARLLPPETMPQAQCCAAAGLTNS